MAKYSVCGIECEQCKVGQSNGCKGCREMSGTIFWGHCDLYDCAGKNKAEHCGRCSSFPCDKLKEWASGENPERIQNLINLNSEV
ncbi:MAG: DUF3795 domain-containing protein [Clostridia bacterium]|nr:DUF3795 domain-containing protein [Clostridia bacterium]